MKKENKRRFKTWMFALPALFLAGMSSAGEMAGGAYRVTRDDVNPGGQAMEGGAYLLTGSVGGLETRMVSSAGFKVTPGLPPMYFHPDTITDLFPSPFSPNQLNITWTAPRGEVPAKNLGPASAYPPASSYIVKYSSVTTLNSQTAFQGATTVSQALVPKTPGSLESLSIPGLLSNTSYFISIESWDADANGRNSSYFSSVISTYTLCNTPDGLAVLAFSSNSALLGWNTRNDDGRDTIVFDAQRGFDAAFTGAQTFQVASNSQLQASYNFTALAQGVPYFFRVRAYNGAGVPTPWSAHVSTQIAVGLPGSLAFTGQTMTGVTANWDAGPNGPGVLYQSRLADNAAFNNELILPAPEASVFSAAYTGLTPNTTYYGRVQAFPAGGGGQPSAFGYLGWTMSGVYRALASTFTAHVSSASFAWGAPVQSNGPNDFFYRVDMSTDSNYGGTVFSSTVPSTQQFTDIAGLTPNTVYYARLVTMNALMIPSSQGPSAFAPSATRPVDPVALGFTSVDDYRIALAWDPNGNNLADSRYRVQVSSDVSGTFGFISASAITPRGATSYQFNAPLQLLANTPYFARIAVVGDSGFDSNYVLYGSTDTRPTTPSGMSFTGMSVSSITVNWVNVGSGGNARNGSGTSYLAEILDAPGGSAVQPPQTVGALAAAWGGLSLNTTYYFRVTALSASASWPDAAPLAGARATLAAPPVMAGIPFSGVTDTTMTVTWAAGPNPAGTSYRVQISSDDTGAFSFVSSFAQGPDLLTNTFTSLASNTTYFARAYGVNHSGDLSAAALNIGAVVTAVRPPIMTSNFSTFSSSITVRWNGNGNAPNTQYRLEDLTTGWFNDNVIGTTFTVTGLLVNSTHDFRVLAYNRVGTPTTYSLVASTWTRAAPPPLMTPGSNSPVSVALQLNTGTNPNGPVGVAARTQYAIQAMAVSPDGPIVFQTGLYLTPTWGAGADPAVLNSAAPVWATRDQWEDPADGDTTFLASGLQPGQFYFWVVYARNGDAGSGPNIPTVAGPATFTTTRSQAPVAFLGTNSGTFSQNNTVWVNSLTIPFQARGAFNTYYDLTQTANKTITAFPTNIALGEYNYQSTQFFNPPAGPGAHGWNGLYNSGAPLAPLAPGGTPLPTASTLPIDSTSSLSGFQVPFEGRWFLHVVGDAYSPNFGFFNHNQDSLDGTSFRVYVDITPPNASGMNLRAQRSVTNSSPIVAGSTVGWATPYFLWDDSEAAGASSFPNSVSPAGGYSWTFSADPSPASNPMASTAAPNFLPAGTRFVQMPAQPAGSFYFKVRTMDAAGNWGAPAVFNYVCDPDLVPPAVTVTFKTYVTLPQGDVSVAVSTGTDAITLTFSEPMDVNTLNFIQLRRLYDNMGVYQGGVNVPVNTMYDGSVSTGASVVRLTPVTGFQGGTRYEIYSASGTGLADLSGNPMATPLSSRFVTLMDPGVRNIMNCESVNGSGQPLSRVDFPAGTWGPVYAGLAINENPTGQGMASPAISGLIAKANRSHDQNSHGYGKPLAVQEFNLYDSNSARIGGAFNQPATITMRFNDADGNGVVDETESTPNPQRVSALGIYWLDENTGVWSRLPSSVIDPAARTVTARLYHFSVYALLGAPQLNLNAAHAYPVPYKPSVHPNGIIFKNLSDFGTISVYTVNGDLVRKIPFDSTNSGQVAWNPVTSDSGDPLASDVYIYLIENNEQKKTGKLLVVR